MMASTTVERVRRSHAEARRTYDRISGLYDWLEGPFEARARRAGLTLLDVRAGERVLDAGYGTGHALVQLARGVGPSGFAAGIDLSAGMEHVARRRLHKAGAHAALTRADAVALPFPDGSFDAAFMSFVLELFDTPDIPVVLGELRRVLRPRGRVGIVALGTREESTRASRLYIAAHRHFPRLVDCRPIPTTAMISAAGFRLQLLVHTLMWGLPVDVVVASPA